MGFRKQPEPEAPVVEPVVEKVEPEAVEPPAPEPPKGRRSKVSIACDCDQDWALPDDAEFISESVVTTAYPAGVWHDCTKGSGESE